MPLENLRRPLLIAAAILLGFTLLIEIGIASAAPFIGRSGGVVGWGIPSLALVDSLLAFTLLLIVAPLVVPERMTGRLQGVVTLVFSVVLFVVALATGIAAFSLLLLLIGLLLAPPFGPIAYAALGYATFPTGSATSTLALLVSSKFAGAVLLILAHQRFLQNKGLVLLLASSILATFVVLFLHGLVPGPLVSVTDLIGAIIVVIIALIWSFVTFVFSVIAVVKALG